MSYFTSPLPGILPINKKNIPNDISAGFIIAALSIPIAMGYAELTGLPAIYGLYASIVASLCYALLSSTRHIVLGMDSATSAMTAAMISLIGISSGEQCLIVIPLITLCTAIFLMLFSLLKAGRFISFVPVPVLAGFIAGISLTVVLGQIPLMLGTSADMSGNCLQDIASVVCCIPNGNIPSAVMSLSCLALLFIFKKIRPNFPIAIVLLLVSAIVTAIFSLSSYGLVMLPAVSGSIPLPSIPAFSAELLLPIIGVSFILAIIVLIESLLCVETFSSSENGTVDLNRETMAFGISNVIVALFGCAPCSNSVSRSAAGIASGGSSQLAMIFSSFIILVVTVFCGPFLSLLPRAALAAIVVYALIDVVDFAKIVEYAKHMKPAFTEFVVSGIIVFAFGAIPGIIAGVLLSILVIQYRSTLDEAQGKLIGTIPYVDPAELPHKKDINTGFSVGVIKVPERLSFMNIDAFIQSIEDEIEHGRDAIILKMSKLDMIDTSATQKLAKGLDSLVNRNIHVKLIRKMRMAADEYSRVEIRSLIQQFKCYPNMKTALLSLQTAHEEDRPAQTAEESVCPGPLEIDEIFIVGDSPVLTVKENAPYAAGDTIEGKISFLQTGKVLFFTAVFSEPGAEDIMRAGYLTDDNETLLAIKKGKKIRSAYNEEQIQLLYDNISTYMRRVIESEKTS